MEKLPKRSKRKIYKTNSQKKPSSKKNSKDDLSIHKERKVPIRTIISSIFIIVIFLHLVAQGSVLVIPFFMVSTISLLVCARLVLKILPKMNIRQKIGYYSLKKKLIAYLKKRKELRIIIYSFLAILFLSLF